MTLHVLINPSRAPLAVAAMVPQDTLILGGAAIALGPEAFPGVAVYALETDCTHWGFEIIEGVTSLTDIGWVDLAAAADRIIHW